MQFNAAWTASVAAIISDQCEDDMVEALAYMQTQLSERALELLALPDDGVPRLLLDVGCGSCLSGDAISEAGHTWVVRCLKQHCTQPQCMAAMPYTYQAPSPHPQQLSGLWLPAVLDANASDDATPCCSTTQHHAAVSSRNMSSKRDCITSRRGICRGTVSPVTRRAWTSARRCWRWQRSGAWTATPAWQTWGRACPCAAAASTAPSASPRCSGCAMLTLRPRTPASGCAASSRACAPSVPMLCFEDPLFRCCVGRIHAVTFWNKDAAV